MGNKTCSNKTCSSFCGNFCWNPSLLDTKLRESPSHHQPYRATAETIRMAVENVFWMSWTTDYCQAVDLECTGSTIGWLGESQYEQHQLSGQWRISVAWFLIASMEDLVSAAVNKPVPSFYFLMIFCATEASTTWWFSWHDPCLPLFQGNHCTIQDPLYHHRCSRRIHQLDERRLHCVSYWWLLSTNLGILLPAWRWWGCAR